MAILFAILAALSLGGFHSGHVTHVHAPIVQPADSIGGISGG
ncbi:MAG TPA: hypothetical protein VIN40_06570 [Candidatus Tyrphobacter sp.]